MYQRPGDNARLRLPASDASQANNIALCALGRRRSKFELVGLQQLRFQDHGLRDNVALLTLLRPRGGAGTSAPGAAEAAANGSAANGFGGHSHSGSGDRIGGSDVGAAGKPQADGAGWHAADVVSCDGSSRGGESWPSALLVANTHILFNPKRGDIKVGNKNDGAAPNRPLAIHGFHAMKQTFPFRMLLVIQTDLASCPIANLT